eukprot:2742611-Rhodomonas_salina.1
MLDEDAASIRILCRDTRSTDVVLESQGAATRLLRLLNENRFCSQRYISNRLEALRSSPRPLQPFIPSRLVEILSPIPTVPPEFASRWRISYVNSEYLLCRRPATLSPDLPAHFPRPRLSPRRAFNRRSRLQKKPTAPGTDSEEPPRLSCSIPGTDIAYHATS